MLYILLCWPSNIIYILCVILCLMFICLRIYVRNPWHWYNIKLLFILKNLFKVRSRRLLWPSTIKYAKKIKLSVISSERISSVNKLIRKLYKYFKFKINYYLNDMYIEHTRPHSAKFIYNNWQIIHTKMIGNTRSL